MRKIIFLILFIYLCQTSYSQDALVNKLFEQITAMGKEYANLKNESDAYKIGQIAKRISAIDEQIRSTEILGLDSLLQNIHQFSNYLNYYVDFIMNPVPILDELKPSVIFARVDSLATFLSSFETIGYDVEYIEELYFSDEFENTGLKNSEISNNKGLSGIKSVNEEQVLTLSKMVGLKCCKIRIKVRIRVVTKSPKKIYDEVVHGLENAVNSVGRLIPEEIKKIGIKVFATAIDIEGDYIHFLNDLNQRVFSVSLSTFEFLRSLQEKTDQELLNATSNLMNTVGLKMTDNVESLLDKMISARSGILKQTIEGFSKTMDLNFKLNELTGDALKLFSKYLLLAGTDFPPMIVSPKPKVMRADAYLAINQSVLQTILKKLFAHTIDLDTARSQGFKLFLNASERKVTFDERSGSVILEIGDFNVKGLYLLGGMANLISPSATINIKKVKVQMVPEISKESPNTINLRPRLFFLDVKNSLPLFDRLIAWAIEKNFLEEKIIPLDMDSLMHDKFQLKASLPAKVPVNIGVLKDYSINDNFLTVAIAHSDQSIGVLQASPIPTNGYSLELSEKFLKNILDQIMNKDGIKVSLKKDTTDEKIFDPTYHFLHLKKLNEFSVTPKGIYIDLNTQVHLRRFLGKKPKLNFEITHAPFLITPVKSINRNGEGVVKLMMLPDIDRLEISKISKKVTRKILKLFKKLKEPFAVAEVGQQTLQKIKFDNPYNRNENLLDDFKNVNITLQDGKIIIVVE